MKEDDVPQKAGLSDEWHRISYAVNREGKYILVESNGCDSVNITNAQAWDVIKNRVDDIYMQVKNEELSTLAFHMAMRQMDAALLSQYTSFYKWQIKRHLKPKVFKTLNDKKLQRYANIFEISIDELLSLPNLESKVKRKINI
ncbi:MAG: helix-turn-helix domain-containing protein [Mariprofundales bacterium]